MAFNYETVHDARDYVNYVFHISSRGIAEVAADMSGLSSNVQYMLGTLAFKTSEYLGQAQTATVGFATAAIAGFSAATQSAAKYEKAISAVEAISGRQVSKDLVSEKAIQMSNEFGMAVEDMTGGLEALARAGVTANKSIETLLESSVQMSTFEGRDLEESINSLLATTNLLNPELDVNSDEFSQTVKELNQQIISTSESSPINAKNIMDTLQHVGGYASAASLDQEDLFAVIAQLGAKGTKGEIAGTSLRAFVSAGQKDKAQRALEDIGLDVTDLWDESGEAMLPISAMKRTLDDALQAKGYTKQQKLEFYSDFVGYKQANQVMKINADEIDKYKDKISNAMSLTDKMDIILGNVQGNWMRITQITRNYLLEVGRKLLVVLNPVLAVTRKILEFITAIPGASTLGAIAGGLIAIRGAAVAINVLLPTLMAFINKFDTKIFNVKDFFSGLVNDLRQGVTVIKSLKDKEKMDDIVNKREVEAGNQALQQQFEQRAINEYFRQLLGYEGHFWEGDNLVSYGDGRVIATRELQRNGNYKYTAVDAKDMYGNSLKGKVTDNLYDFIGSDAFAIGEKRARWDRLDKLQKETYANEHRPNDEILNQLTESLKLSYTRELEEMLAGSKRRAAVRNESPFATPSKGFISIGGLITYDSPVSEIHLETQYIRNILVKIYDSARKAEKLFDEIDWSYGVRTGIYSPPPSNDSSERSSRKKINVDMKEYSLFSEHVRSLGNDVKNLKQEVVKYRTTPKRLEQNSHEYNSRPRMTIEERAYNDALEQIKARREMERKASIEYKRQHLQGIQKQRNEIKSLYADTGSTFEDLKHTTSRERIKFSNVISAFFDGLESLFDFKFIRKHRDWYNRTVRIREARRQHDETRDRKHIKDNPTGPSMRYFGVTVPQESIDVNFENHNRTRFLGNNINDGLDYNIFYGGRHKYIRQGDRNRQIKVGKNRRNRFRPPTSYYKNKEDIQKVYDDYMLNGVIKPFNTRNTQGDFTSTLGISHGDKTISLNSPLIASSAGSAEDYVNEILSTIIHEMVHNLDPDTRLSAASHQNSHIDKPKYSNRYAGNINIDFYTGQKTATELMARLIEGRLTTKDITKDGYIASLMAMFNSMTARSPGVDIDIGTNYLNELSSIIQANDLDKWIVLQNYLKARKQDILREYDTAKSKNVNYGMSKEDYTKIIDDAETLVDERVEQIKEALQNIEELRTTGIRLDKIINEHDLSSRTSKQLFTINQKSIDWGKNNNISYGNYSDVEAYEKIEQAQAYLDEIMRDVHDNPMDFNRRVMLKSISPRGMSELSKTIAIEQEQNFLRNFLFYESKKKPEVYKRDARGNYLGHNGEIVLKKGQEKWYDDDINNINRRLLIASDLTAGLQFKKKGYNGQNAYIDKETNKVVYYIDKDNPNIIRHLDENGQNDKNYFRAKTVYYNREGQAVNPEQYADQLAKTIPTKGVKVHKVEGALVNGAWENIEKGVKNFLHDYRANGTYYESGEYTEGMLVDLYKLFDNVDEYGNILKLDENGEATSDIAYWYNPYTSTYHEYDPLKMNPADITDSSKKISRSTLESDSSLYHKDKFGNYIDNNGNVYYQTQDADIFTTLSPTEESNHVNKFGIKLGHLKTMKEVQKMVRTMTDYQKMYVGDILNVISKDAIGDALDKKDWVASGWAKIVRTEDIDEITKMIQEEDGSFVNPKSIMNSDGSTRFFSNKERVNKIVQWIEDKGKAGATTDERNAIVERYNMRFVDEVLMKHATKAASTLEDSNLRVGVNSNNKVGTLIGFARYMSGVEGSGYMGTTTAAQILQQHGFKVDNLDELGLSITNALSYDSDTKYGYYLKTLNFLSDILKAQTNQNELTESQMQQIHDTLDDLTLEYFGGHAQFSTAVSNLVETVLTGVNQNMGILGASVRTNQTVIPYTTQIPETITLPTGISINLEGNFNEEDAVKYANPDAVKLMFGKRVPRKHNYDDMYGTNIYSFLSNEQEQAKQDQEVYQYGGGRFTGMGAFYTNAGFFTPEIQQQATNPEGWRFKFLNYISKNIIEDQQKYAKASEYLHGKLTALLSGLAVAGEQLSIFTESLDMLSNTFVILKPAVWALESVLNTLMSIMSTIGAYSQFKDFINESGIKESVKRMFAGTFIGGMVGDVANHVKTKIATKMETVVRGVDSAIQGAWSKIAGFVVANPEIAAAAGAIGAAVAAALVAITGYFVVTKLYYDHEMKEVEKLRKEVNKERAATKAGWINTSRRLVNGGFANEGDKQITQMNFERYVSQLNMLIAKQDMVIMRRFNANDSVWGEYHFIDELKTKLADSVFGEWLGLDKHEESKKYEGTTQEIREIKENALANEGGLSLTTKSAIRRAIGPDMDAERDMAAFYDSHKLAFYAMEEHADELDALYRKETAMQQKYGSPEKARASKEFQDTVEVEATSMGISKEDLISWLDWKQTEYVVSNAKSAMQNQRDLILLQAKNDAYQLQYGVSTEESMNLNKDKSPEEQRKQMIEAQAKSLAYEMQYELLWEGIAEVLAGMFTVMWGIFDLIRLFMTNPGEILFGDGLSTDIDKIDRGMREAGAGISLIDKSTQDMSGMLNETGEKYLTDWHEKHDAQGFLTFSRHRNNLMGTQQTDLTPGEVGAKTTERKNVESIHDYVKKIYDKMAEEEGEGSNFSTSDVLDLASFIPGANVLAGPLQSVSQFWGGDDSENESDDESNEQKNNQQKTTNNENNQQKTTNNQNNQQNNTPEEKDTGFWSNTFKWLFLNQPTIPTMANIYEGFFGNPENANMLSNVVSGEYSNEDNNDTSSIKWDDGQFNIDWGQIKNEDKEGILSKIISHIDKTQKSDISINNVNINTEDNAEDIVTQFYETIINLGKDVNPNNVTNVTNGQNNNNQNPT